MKADSNCLFRTFSAILTGTEEHHSVVRAFIVSYMLAESSIFASVCPDVREHINKTNMAACGTWETELEILAFSTFLEIPAHVFTVCGDKQKWMTYQSLEKKDSDRATERVFIINLNSHFEPVLKFF